MADVSGKSPTSLEGFKRQECRVCGCEEKFNFHVHDDIWKKAVPQAYRNKVVCLSCFDNFARERNVAYSKSVVDLLFAGDKAAMKFEPKSTKDL